MLFKSRSYNSIKYNKSWLVPVPTQPRIEHEYFTVEYKLRIREIHAKRVAELEQVTTNFYKWDLLLVQVWNSVPDKAFFVIYRGICKLHTQGS